MTLSVDDRLELTELIVRLSHALDFSRPEDVVSLFTVDGVYRAVSSVASGEQPRFRHEGAAALRAFAEAAVESRRGLGRHWTGSYVLEETPSGASAVSYVLFIEINADTKQRTILISGVHRDSFVRTPEGWRFAERVVVADV